MEAVGLLRQHSGHRRWGTPLLDAKQTLQSTPPPPPPQPTASSSLKRAECCGLGGAFFDLLRHFDTLLLLLTLACLVPWTSRNPQSLSLEPHPPPFPLPLTLTFNGYGVNPDPLSMARVYADINANMPRSYWDYDSVNISWGVLENYEVVRKIGVFITFLTASTYPLLTGS
jgi:hypothetical protein